jgi:hypothetical protein
MMVIILFVLCLVLLFLAVRRAQARRSPVVAVTAHNIALRGWRTQSSVAWSEIRQIDVARTPGTPFCVILFGNNAVAVYDHSRGFEEFSARMFEHWPTIGAEWMRLRNAPPQTSERVTVWQQS